MSWVLKNRLEVAVDSLVVNNTARFVISKGEDLTPGPKTVSVTQSFVYIFIKSGSDRKSF